MKTFSIIIISASLFFLTCATMKGTWKKAEEKNTITAYEEFLQKYPESEFSNEAKTKIEELYFQEVKQNSTITSYEKFLEKYPNSKYAEEAKKEIEVLSFEEARKNKTVASYEKFLEKYPNSKYAEEAKKEIELLYFLKAETENSIHAYVNFIKKYPDSDLKDQASFKIKELVSDKFYSEAIDYLKQIPNDDIASMILEYAKDNKNFIIIPPKSILFRLDEISVQEEIKKATGEQKMTGFGRFEPVFDIQKPKGNHVFLNVRMTLVGYGSPIEIEYNDIVFIVQGKRKFSPFEWINSPVIGGGGGLMNIFGIETSTAPNITIDNNTKLTMFFEVPKNIKTDQVEIEIFGIKVGKVKNLNVGKASDWIRMEIQQQ